MFLSFFVSFLFGRCPSKMKNGMKSIKPRIVKQMPKNDCFFSHILNEENIICRLFHSSRFYYMAKIEMLTNFACSNL